MSLFHDLYHIGSKTKNLILGYMYYYRDRKTYCRQFHKNEELFKRRKKNDYPILTDRFGDAGTIDSHYFLQDIYMSRLVIMSKATMHYDIGSRVEGFVSHLLAAGVNVTMIDIRPFPIDMDNLHFSMGNAMDLVSIPSNSILSLSCLHALEHFGLGRYGDPVDKDGWLKALHEYVRVLAKGGILYLSVPIGPEDKVMFNAHRIFRPMTIVHAAEGLVLQKFSYIKEYKIRSIDIAQYNDKDDYLCGLFIFEKE